MSVFHLFVGMNQVFIYAKLTLDSSVVKTALEIQILYLLLSVRIVGPPYLLLLRVRIVGVPLPSPPRCENCRCSPTFSPV